MGKPTHYGISARLTNLDTYYTNLCLEAAREGFKGPDVLNDIVKNKADVGAVTDTIESIVINRIHNGKLNNKPICSSSCEHPLVGRINIGTVCPVCGYKVTPPRMVPELFLKAPDVIGVFINPHFWAKFNTNFGGQRLPKFGRKKLVLDRGFDLMMWMVDKHYRTDENIPPRARAVIRVLEENGYKRGIHNFTNHYKTWFDILTREDNWKEIYSPSRNKHADSEKERANWIAFFREQSNSIFSRHLPIIPTRLIVSEENERGVSFDPVFATPIDAIKNMAMLLTKSVFEEDRFFVSKALKVNRQLAQFYVDFRKEYCGGKRGLYRSKVNSTHSAYTGRATITPISGPHDAWKIRAPWRWLVGLMATHIESKLLMRGYSAREAGNIVDFAAMQYHEVVHEIFLELIRESPGGYGIGVIPLRNPTLVQLSIQFLFIDEVNTDVEQCSIGISNRVIKMANADFDGDQFQVQLATDEETYREAMKLRPDMGFLSPREVDRVESGMVIHNELVSMQHEYLSDTSEDNEVGIPLDQL